ncbi:MAG: carbohydrate kinase [Bacteroidia bacterium]|nr:carbohydrate kinase [Bacteroidia bacterium]NND11767.1 carbohydrate kinase [Flavobacteriaceae bacterium]MBT8308817.1 carbohydrate kinase [Bacteroidia bacterium]NNK27853.1 carbohydrate kinase [Flavobacteriaceae bacterium]NNL61232.1 carbohydrate kinase [Flavobacteriaceae bacterium]
MNKVQATCYGEILWDVFPTHKVIGGAPLNVALRLQSFGIESAIISRIGSDENGDKALDFISDKTLNKDHIQLDSGLETGHVIVTLDKNGSASYEIFNPVAWDNIQLDQNNMNLVTNSDVFIFGSLAAREDTSRQTLFSLLEIANYKVFDVNLRPPHYDFELLYDLMNSADFIKMNDEEIIEICNQLKGDTSDLEGMMKYISLKTNTSAICVTLGSKGALLYHEGSFHRNKGYKAVVEDTVGAGDSFLAGLIGQLIINKKSPQDSLDFACAIGSLVASKKGANSKVSSEEIKNILNEG